MKAREHNWNEGDMIICLYYYKFGVNRLPVSSDNELAESVIGSSLDSLKMMRSNISYILDEKGLYQVSYTQKDVVAKYSNLSESDLRKKVVEIINSPERECIISERKNIRKKKLTDNELKEYFIKIGKDPKKMKSIGMRQK